MGEFEHIFQTLSKSEVDFQEFFYNSTLGIGLFNLDGAIVDCNPALLEMFDVPDINAASKHPLEFFFVETKTKHRLKNEVVNNGFIKERIIPFRTYKGKVISALVNGNLIERKQDNLVMISLLDVTVQKNLEGKLKNLTQRLMKEVGESTRELKIHKEKYELLFESSRDAIVVFDGDLISDCNPAALNLFGFEVKEDFIGLTIEDISPEFQPDGKSTSQKAKEVVGKTLNREMDQFTWLHQKNDGSLFTCEITASLFIQGDKPLLHVLVRDISDKVGIHQALKKSEEKYKQLFESSRDAVLMFDGKKISDCNKASISLLEYEKKEDLVGLGIGELTPELQFDGINSIEKANQIIEKVIGGENPGLFRWDQKTKSGRIFPCEIIVTKINEAAPYSFHILLRDISARVVSDRELKNSEVRYRTLFELSRDAVLIYQNGKIIDCNEATLQMFGCKNRDDIIGKHPGELSPPKQPDGSNSIEFSNSYIQRTHDDIQPEFEWIHKRMDGTEFPVEITLSSMSINDELTLHAIIRDISKKKEAEKALKESEEKYRTLLNNIPHKVFYKDINSIYLAVNPAYAKTLNLQPADMVGKNDLDFFPEELARKYQTDDQEVMQKGITLDLEEKYIVKNQTKTIQTIKTPVYDAAGKLRGVLGIFWDITEKVRLKEERNLMFNRSVDMMCIAGFDGYYKYLNPAWTKALGWSIKELTSQPWIEFVHPDDIEKTLEANEKLANDEQILLFDNRYRCKDGSYKWISWNTLPFSDHDMIFGIARDITQRKLDEQKLKESEQELRKINAQKDRFFSIVSHDLRSPMSSLYQISEVLDTQFEEFTDEEKHTYMHVIKETAKNTLDLTEDLLTWARGQMGKLDIVPESLSLKNLVNETISLLSPLAIDKEINLFGKIDKKLTVFADSNSVKLILRNLVTNAIKYTPTGGIISICAEDTGNNAVVTRVIDHGIGMRQEQLDKLFDITEIVSTKGTNNEKGTGLGLLLCKDLTEKNNGAIWVKSKPGKGSEFAFSLPNRL